MKLRHSIPAIVALTTLVILTAPSAQAGAAVASDGHGGYGFVYGPKSLGKLRREAFDNCVNASHYPSSVKIIGSTESVGAGVIVRYKLESGREQIAAWMGSPSARYARDKAINYALNHGAVSYKIVREWSE